MVNDVLDLLKDIRIAESEVISIHTTLDVNKASDIDNISPMIYRFLSTNLSLISNYTPISLLCIL